MRKIVIILGIVSIAVYSLYSYETFLYLSELEKKGVVLDYYSPLYIYGDIANCIIYLMISALYLIISRSEPPKLRWLVYWPISMFWTLLSITYIYNRIFDNFIQFNRIFIVLIAIVLILLSCYISSLIISCFKSCKRV